MSHEQCPRKFSYSYILKPQKGYVDRTALLKGGAVHHILEKYPSESTHKWAPKYQHIADKFIASDLGRKYFNSTSMNEFSFGLTEKLEITEYKDKTGLFRGKIDRVQVVDGVLHLIDWKTGKYKEEKWQDFRQLLFYAIYFFRRYPNIDKIKISYVYVEHDLENGLMLERQYLLNYVKQLTDLIRAVETDTTYVKTPSRLCDWCDYKEYCSKDI